MTTNEKYLKTQNSPCKISVIIKRGKKIYIYIFEKKELRSALKYHEVKYTFFIFKKINRLYKYHVGS